MLAVSGATRAEVEALARRGLRRRRTVAVIGRRQRPAPRRRERLARPRCAASARPSRSAAPPRPPRSRPRSAVVARSTRPSSPIPVALGFHHPALAPAVDMVRDWAEACGLDAGLAEHLAHAICVETVDWPRELADAVGPDTRWVVDLGPADLSANMTGRALRGRGVTVIPAATEPRAATCSSPPAPRCRTAADWSAYAPAPDRPRRRQARRRHRLHPPHRQVADPARRHDPDHRRPRDRRGRRERRPLGRARRRRPGHRADLRRQRRQADRAPRRGPHGAVQHPLPRPLPVEAAGRRPAPRAEGAPGRRARSTAW